MWIFLHVKINDDDDGALYHRSEIIQLNSYMTHNNDVVITSWPDLVAAILSYWVGSMLSSWLNVTYWDFRSKIALQTLQMMIGW